MPLNSRHDVHLEFTSAFEMLDFVQIVSEHMGRSIGLDEDSRHWVGVAVRESVINAIKHGNRNDSSKRVFVDFEAAPETVPELTIRVREFRTYVTGQRHHSYRYENDLRVGADLPSSGVTYYEVPREYGVTRYRYTVVNDRTVLVDPGTHRIVEIID